MMTIKDFKEFCGETLSKLVTPVKNQLSAETKEEFFKFWKTLAVVPVAQLVVSLASSTILKHLIFGARIARKSWIMRVRSLKDWVKTLSVWCVSLIP